MAAGRASRPRRPRLDGVVVARVDGLAAGDLRDLAIAVRHQPGIRLVVLGGETTSGGVALVAAVAPGPGDGSRLIKDAAKAVGVAAVARATSPWPAARTSAGSRGARVAAQAIAGAAGSVSTAGGSVSAGSVPGIRALGIDLGSKRIGIAASDFSAAPWPRR